MTAATVFVIDDDDAVRDSLGLLLELSGQQVRGFASAEEFLAALGPQPYGCLVLDLRLGGMDGLSLQQELARRQLALPIVMITGHGDVAAARQALKGGAIDFLEKPVDETVLLACVREAMQREEQRREQEQQGGSARERLQRLTERESEVMQLVAEGLTSKAIGEQLGISPRTVEVYRARLMEKLQVSSVPELVKLALSARH